LHAYKFYSDDSIVSARFFDYGLSTKKGLAPSVIKSTPVKNGVHFDLLLPEPGNNTLLVYRKEKTSQPMAVIAEVAIRDTSVIPYTDTTAKDPYMIYQYAFAVKSKSFITSDTSAITQSRSGVPGMPKGVKKFTGYYQDKTVNLHWEVDSTQEYLLGYLLEKRIVDDKGKGLTDFKNIASVKQVVLMGNHFTDTLLVPGKSYEYRVTAVDDHYRQSADKLSRVISIPGILPVAPAGLRSVLTADGVVLEWGSGINENAKSYKVYRYQRGKDPISIATLSTDQRSYTDKSAAKGELYFYYLTTLSADNKESLPSEEIGARFQP
jgi:fibronectin type 3 domain-containing protein